MENWYKHEEHSVKSSSKFDQLLMSMKPHGRDFRYDKINPSLHQDEKRLVLMAINGTDKADPIVKVGVEPHRKDSFLIQGRMGKGPYHFFELSKSKTETNLAREWMVHVAALAKLYYEENYPADSMKFEYNYKCEPQDRNDYDLNQPYDEKGYSFLMDIVVFGLQNEMLLYVEVKKRMKEIEDLKEYLNSHNAPLINTPDRKVPNADQIRKAKYLWYSRVPRLWLACPENLSAPEQECYDAIYDEEQRTIVLKKNPSVIKHVKAKLDLIHTL